MISYASRSLTTSEKKKSAFEFEVLSLKWAVIEKCSDYLMNTEFIVYTDNNPSTYILTGAKLDATRQRWASALGHFYFKMIYRHGLNNKDVDAMSRYSFEKLNEDNCEQIENNMVKTIYQTTQIESVIEVFPLASINIVDATESPWQPLAKIEQIEIKKSERGFGAWQIDSCNNR